MKTKQTKVGLSLLVIVTALTFGMGGASAKGELIQLKKGLKGEIWYSNKNWNSITVRFAHLLTIYSRN